MKLESLPLLAAAEEEIADAGVVGLPVAESEDAAIASLLSAFREHRHFIVTSHARPDGDAIGSSLALAEVLEQLGCSCEVVLAGSAPAIYRTLPNLGRIRFTDSAAMPDEGDLTPAILLECDGIARTGLKGLEGRMLINIDHHASGREFGAINWIDPGACAVAAMVYRIAVAAGVEITRSMAVCLYTSILSDTGAFTYPNTTPESFAIAHDLTLRGAVPSQIARDLYFTNPLSKVRLLGSSLAALQISGSLAWSWVTLADLERTRATAEDCEGIVGNLIAIEGIDAAFFLREQPDGQFRLSIRSKGNLNVARVAEAFHGGGHLNASGCTLEGPLESAIERVLGELGG
jgi:phosphoesterase RecJ-like protein